MRCDECDNPKARRYFMNWLCRLHGLYLMASLGLTKGVILTKKCNCECHDGKPYQWCDKCWNNKNHGLQLFPIKEGMIREDGKKITKDDVLNAIQKHVLKNHTPDTNKIMKGVCGCPSKCRFCKCKKI